MARPQIQFSTAPNAELDTSNTARQTIMAGENANLFVYEPTLEALKDLLDMAIEKRYSFVIWSAPKEIARYIEQHARPSLTLKVTLACSLDYDISEIEDDLNIRWSDVRHYNIKWMTLFITMNDGRELEYILETDGVDLIDSLDMKRPLATDVF